MLLLYVALRIRCLKYRLGEGLSEFRMRGIAFSLMPSALSIDKIKKSRSNSRL
jgi:hypothetical protein